MGTSNRVGSNANDAGATLRDENDGLRGCDDREGDRRPDGGVAI